METNHWAFALLIISLCTGSNSFGEQGRQRPEIIFHSPVHGAALTSSEVLVDVEVLGFPMNEVEGCAVIYLNTIPSPVRMLMISIL
mmetsp:Transcript_65602/g.175859  ORF Transcript_65602/g.175859 Transcript_65602/m.175859 type:complete len:86 (-) Transcript_65602:343-600(-)